tara:strand:+ start:115 stop:780 length:666 start_codon:yes stop_codon:yes gene_type:complete
MNFFYQVVSFKHKLIFLTPPKCSTFSLQQFLIDANIEVNKPLRPLSTPFYHATLSEIVYSYKIDLEELKQYKVIQILRNPYDRFISSYFHQQDLIGKQIDFNTFLKKVEQFKYLLPYNINEFYLNFYQDDGGVRFYYEQNWWNNLNIKVNINYLKLEDISKNSTSLCKLLNLDYHIPFLCKNKNPIDKSQFYKEFNNISQYKSRIYTLFKKDFKLYNYEKF